MARTEGIKIYCHQHDVIHEISALHAEKLIYQYQYRIAEAATSPSLPQNNPLTSLDNVVRHGFCPVGDYRMKQTPGWKKFIENTVAKKRHVSMLDSQARARRTRNANRGKEITR